MRLSWDKAGERLYETGVDRGVFYPFTTGGKYGSGVAWNGLTAVNETPSGAEPTALWANNKKYLTLMSAEELGLTIEAYTYPDEYHRPAHAFPLPWPESPLPLPYRTRHRLPEHPL